MWNHFPIFPPFNYHFVRVFSFWTIFEQRTPDVMQWKGMMRLRLRSVNILYYQNVWIWRINCKTYWCTDDYTQDRSWLRNFRGYVTLFGCPAPTISRICFYAMSDVIASKIIQIKMKVCVSIYVFYILGFCLWAALKKRIENLKCRRIDVMWSTMPFIPHTHTHPKNPSTIRW